MSRAAVHPLTANTPGAWSERAKNAATSHEAALWSQEGQQERFAVVLSVLGPRPGDTILDFGCGTGALADLIPSDVGYVGCDWAPGMIHRARREHPDRDFVLEQPSGPFDFVAAVGPFNLADGWDKDMTWRTLDLLWGSTRKALAASLYFGDDPGCIRYTAAECAEYASRNAERFAVIVHRWNDLLVVLNR